MPEASENYLLHEELPALFRKLTLPAVLSMLTLGLYQFVDSIFIGQFLGADGLAAITLAYPYSLLCGGIASMVSIGAASLLSIRWGAENLDGASRILSTATVLTVICSIVIGGFGFSFAQQITEFLGGEGSTAVESAIYIRIIAAGSVFFIYSATANSLIRAEGKMRTAMIVQGSGAILNIILDPIFIKVFDLGISGAAFATIIAQAVVCAAAVIYFSFSKGVSRFPQPLNRIDFSAIPQILKVGISALLLETMTLVQMTVIYKIIDLTGSNGDIAVIGAVMRVLNFAFIPLWGISQAFQPLCGVCFGAGDFDRLNQSLKVFIVRATIFAFICHAAILIFSEIIMSLFLTDPLLLERSIPVIRIMTSLFSLYGVMILLITFLQSTGNAKGAGMLVASRMLLFFIPIVFITVQLYGIKGLWIATPAADGLVVITGSIYVFNKSRYFRNQI